MISRTPSFLSSIESPAEANTLSSSSSKNPPIAEIGKIPASSLIGTWNAGKQREVVLYLSDKQEVEGLIFPEKGPLEKGEFSRSFEKISSSVIFAGINKAHFSPSLIQQLKENPLRYRVVLTQNETGAVLTLLPELAGGMDSNEEAVLEEVKKGLAIVKAKPNHPNSHDRFGETLRMAQNISKGSYEDLLEICKLLAKAKLEMRGLEPAYQCCKNLLDFFRQKEVLASYEVSFLEMIKELHNTLAEKELFQEAQRYLILATQIMTESQSAERQLNFFLEWGDNCLNVPFRNSFDKYKEAAYYHAAAYRLTCTAPELAERQLEALKALLQVQGKYLRSKLGNCKSLHERYALQCAPVNLNKLKEEQKALLLQKIERIADYLCVRGCFHDSDQDARPSSSQEAFDPVYSFYTLAEKLANQIGADVNKLKAKKDEAMLGEIPLELLEREKRFKRQLDEIRGHFVSFMNQDKFPFLEELETKIYENYKHLIGDLFEESSLLFNPDAEYPYALLGLGSLSRREMCPFSDVEAAVVLKDASHQAYFLPIAELFSLYIISLGESNWPNFPECRRILPRGFLLDQNNNPFSFRDSVENLTHKQVFKEQGEDIVSLNALRTPCFLKGAQQLYDEYCISLRRVFNENKSSKKHAQKAIRDYLNGFPAFSCGEEINIKMDLLRFPILVFEALCLYYQNCGIEFVAHTTEKIKALCRKGLFSWVLEEKWRECLEFAFTRRWQNHLGSGEENDLLSLSAEDKEIVQEFYDLLFTPLRKVLEEWLTKESALQDYTVFSQTYFEKGVDLIEKRNYKEALQYLIRASLLKEDSLILLELGHLHFFLADFQGARIAWEKALYLTLTKASMLPSIEQESDNIELFKFLSVLARREEKAFSLLKYALNSAQVWAETPDFAFTEEEFFQSRRNRKSLLQVSTIPFLRQWLSCLIEVMICTDASRRELVEDLNRIFEELPLSYRKILQEEVVTTLSRKGGAVTQAGWNLVTALLKRTSDSSEESLQDFLSAWNGPAAINELVLSDCHLTWREGEIISRELEAPTSSLHLVRLNLANNFMGSIGGMLLARALESNNTLTELNLEGNRLGVLGGKALARALNRNITLTSLNLSLNNLSAEVGTALASMLKARSVLTHLNLRGNNLGETGGIAIAQALEENSTLLWLNIAANEVNSKAGSAFGKTLVKNQTLTHLDLASNGIDAQAGKTIGEALDFNGSLTSLSLQQNPIGDVVVLETVAHSLHKNHVLTHLDLGKREKDSPFGIKGIEALGKALTMNTTIRYLDLSGGGIGLEGAKLLGYWLKGPSFKDPNRSLEHLILSSNSIPSDGIENIAAWLASNATLIALDLSHNTIDCQGAKALANALKTNKSLKILNLEGNRIGSLGKMDLVKFLEVNQILCYLNLSDNKFKSEIVDALIKTLDKRKPLKYLDLSRNEIGFDKALALVQALRNTSRPIHLDISDNLLTEEEQGRIAQASSNKLLSLTIKRGCVEKKTKSHVKPFYVIPLIGDKKTNSLSYEDPGRLTDEILLSDIKKMPEVHHLYLQNCYKLTSQSIYNIVMVCRHLQTLNIRRNSFFHRFYSPHDCLILSAKDLQELKISFIPGELTSAPGKSFVHQAVLTGNKKLVENLILQGADCNSKDYRGNTPLDYAMELGNREMISFLDGSQELLALYVGRVVFGKKDWEEYFGDIGAEPPLPNNIYEVLQSPCPIWPWRKVQDTHLLTLIPEKVNGSPLTLDLLQDLVTKTKGGGNKTEYRCYWDKLKNEHGSKPSGPSYWVLMTKDVLPNTLDKTYDEQVTELNTRAARAPQIKGLGKYQTPKALEAATSILMEYVRSGVKLYSNDSSDSEYNSDDEWTWACCEETVDGKYHLAVGGFAASGLGFHNVDWEYEDDENLPSARCGSALAVRFW